MTIHGSLFTEFKEKDTWIPSPCRTKLLRIDMRYGEVQAKAGSMVAYQGMCASRSRAAGWGGCSRQRSPARVSR